MTPEDVLGHRLPIFDGLSLDDLAGIAPRLHERRYDAWATLFNQHDTTRDVFFLLSGSLLAVHWTRNGRDIIFSRFSVGSYFGELAALDGEERSLSVVARTPATVLLMPQASFVDLFDRIPVVRDRVARNLCERIRYLTARNLELTTFTVEQRVASYLLNLALERGKLETGVVLEAAPTHAEIAASIGANREIVSRTMTALRRKGAIRASRQRIEILDAEALSETL